MRCLKCVYNAKIMYSGACLSDNSIGTRVHLSYVFYGFTLPMPLVLNGGSLGTSVIS